MTIETAATRAVAATGISHRVVEYGKVAGLEEAARKRGVPVEKVMKSLVVRTGKSDFVMVIVPGNRVIDWPKLRLVIGMSRMALATTEEALEVTGYPPGAITPFGSRQTLPVICDVSITGEISIGGGAHGVAIHLNRDDLIAATGGRVADVTREANVPTAEAIADS